MIVAEPVHGIGYLPLYVAIAKGYFDELGLDVKIVTIESGSGHTNAVLSGQAFAFIGGPEHNAFAKLKGARAARRGQLSSIAATSISCAAKGQEPTGTDWPAYFKGKTIAVGPFGGTPNSITRYLLGKWKLDAKKDVDADRDHESADHRRGEDRQAQIGAVTEPLVTQGIRKASGTSRSSTCRRSSVPMPIRRSTCGSTRSRRTRTGAQPSCAAWSRA